MNSACERLHGAVPLLVRIVDHLGHPVETRPFTVVVEDAERDVQTTEDGLIRTILPKGAVALEVDGEKSVFFGNGYEFYTHDKVSEFDSVDPQPFPQDPGSKNDRITPDLIEELTESLAALFNDESAET